MSWVVVQVQGLAAEITVPLTPSLPALLAMAFLAAMLANLVNNLPATLLLLTALGPHPQAGIVLAMLLGVNLGPNATYIGSLATLLWRRVLARRGMTTTLPEFVQLGVWAVPTTLLASTTSLWAALQLTGFPP